MKTQIKLFYPDLIHLVERDVNKWLSDHLSFKIIDVRIFTMHNGTGIMILYEVKV